MTKRRPAIEVEPLSAKRWSEIERNLLDRAAADAPSSAPTVDRRRWVAAGAVVLAAAAIAIAWIVRPHEHDREALTASSHVVTEGAATHTTAGDVAIDVDARSSVMLLERQPDAWLVSIEHGGARFRVPPRRGRPTFVVQAGLVRVEVVGTRFHVEREPGSTRVRVDVEHGTVRVVARGEEVLVHAGEHWPAEQAQITDTREADQPSPSVASAAQARANDPVERAEEGPADDRRHEDRDAARQGRRAPDPSGVVAAPVAQTADVRAPTPHERFARAEALEPTDPATALREYEALAREGGAWGANALFAQARLELDLGHRERARSLLERYLAQHPRALNAEDARTLLERTR